MPLFVRPKALNQAGKLSRYVSNHPIQFVGRRNEYRQKLGSKQVHHIMH